MALRPGTPEFEARARAVAGGAQQAAATSAPQVQPPNLSLNTNVGQAPEAERFSAPTSNDPRLSGLADEAGAWQRGLASGSDSDATLAIQRARDLQAGQRQGLADQMALGSGFGGARNQRLAMLSAGQGRELAGLNADLTADARAKQNQAFQTRSGLEQNIAQERLGRGQLQLSGTQANNSSALNRYTAQNAATLAAQGLNLQAWQGAQNASAEQQRLAMQAQESNNQNLWRAFQANSAVAPSGRRSPTNINRPGL